MTFQLNPPPRPRWLYQTILANRHEGWRGYVFAAGITCAALMIHLLLEPVIGPHALFAVFIPATLLAALTAGMGPALLSIGLSVAFTFALPHTAENRILGRVAVYTGLGLLIAWIGNELRQGGLDAVRAEQDIYQQQAQIGVILRSVPDATIVIDRSGGIISFNPAAERQFGYAEHDVAGKNINYLMPEPYASAHDTYLRRYAETGEKHIMGAERIVHARRSDGSVFPIRLTIGELQAHDRTYYIGFLRDLTERTETLAQVAQLQEKISRLSRLTEIGEMASALAHELNQPLSAITTFTQGSLRLLQDMDGASAGRLRGALEETARQALRAGRIVHHLRESTVHAGVEKKRESLRAVIEDATKLAVAAHSATYIKVDVRYDTDADDVLIDRSQIQQVLVNLVGNAMDSMSGLDKGALTIRTHMDGDTAVMVDIADTGPGISEEVSGHLFQPFVTDKAGGLGVGLSIARRIIQDHGGTLVLLRNEASGATFRVTLPLASREIPA